MITKIDNPSKAESKDYNNKGSVARLNNYLKGNEEKIDKNDLYFDFENENIDPDEIKNRIDNNVKGLKADDHKFFSISINPSYDELKWIENDKGKMKSFVREAMRNYAKSFKQEGINEKDLVWAAIIHEKRFYTEKEVYIFKKKNPSVECNFNAGDVKPGNNMHAHIIVSARNKEMTKTLNSLTANNKISRNFQLKEFQRLNQNSFQQLFYYKNGVNIYAEMQMKMVEKRIHQLTDLGYQSQDFEKIKRVGEKMNFDAKYTRNLGQLVNECYHGNVIKDTELYLEEGAKKYREKHPDGVEEGAFKRPERIENDTEGWNPLIRAAEVLENNIKRQKQEREDRRRRKKKGKNRNL